MLAPKYGVFHGGEPPTIGGARGTKGLSPRMPLALPQEVGEFQHGLPAVRGGEAGGKIHMEGLMGPAAIGLVAAIILIGGYWLYKWIARVLRSLFKGNENGTEKNDSEKKKF